MNVASGDESGPVTAVATRPDVTPPETAIVSGPAGSTSERNPSFSFSATDEGSQAEELLYSHMVGAGAWSPFSPETSVTLGGEPASRTAPHLLGEGKGRLGQRRPDPAERAFSVDLTGPVAERTMPTEGLKGVRFRTNVVAFFSEEIEPASVNPDTVVLFKGGTNVRVAARVTYDAASRKATLEPEANLANGKTYRAVVTPGVRDLVGKHLDQDPSVSGDQRKTWSFTVQR